MMEGGSNQELTWVPVLALSTTNFVTWSEVLTPVVHTVVCGPKILGVQQ